MQIISNGKLNTVQIKLPVVTTLQIEKQPRNTWENCVDEFFTILEPYLIQTKQKPWDRAKISKRLRFARVKNYHISDFLADCKSKGYDLNKYNFYVHFFSKTKVVFRKVK